MELNYIYTRIYIYATEMWRYKGRTKKKFYAMRGGVRKSASMRCALSRIF